MFGIQREGLAILIVFMFEHLSCELKQNCVVMLTFLQSATVTSKTTVTFENFEKKNESKALSSFSFKLS